MSHVYLVASISLLLFYIHICEGENKNSDTKTSEAQHKPTTDPTEFLDDNEKKKWHVKRLWDADFIGDAEDTNNTKYGYRESLRKDGGNVKYVTAEELTVDEQEIKQSNIEWNKQHSRRGEYVIDTVEYDEEVTFDPNKDCPPGAVTVIDLTVFQQINYDLVCTQTIIWNILES